ncbi:YfiR family protein [Paraburkholderia silviterrae]|uniref:YfiR family protein n=1 Tax=Paraburkholderia silviterrae TaxID=2528715 RepID=A0A4R5M6U1_9BURK|nr:YfiR family protein [Paraburkholderia silviterrae]TDG21848.1 YfiR family protein [Paraburkholderia silviterrae]
MHARVRAAIACRAVAMTPGGAAAIAAQAMSARPGWAALLRHALLSSVLLAMACVLCGATAVLADTSDNTVDPASPARAVTATSHADPAISPRDAAVRQVVLGIISFTHWPTPPARLHLCVTGQPDYAHALVDTLQAGSTPLDVQRLHFDDAALGKACEIVYLGNLTDDERQQVSATVAGHPVLTIAEHDPSCTAGSMFCLNVDGNRVTFDINLDAVARSGVRVHPNVLNLARRPVTP